MNIETTTLHKRITARATIVVDVGPGVANGETDEGIRRMRCERTGRVYIMLARVVREAPVTHRREEWA